jgi:tetratricopeptide (TPR) repeat protein
MAPEQVEGRGIDHRVDLYALGLILYEMLTGDVPFHADTTIQLMYRRVNEEPKSPKELNPDLPDWLVRVVMKCLERLPDNRYQSAADILRDLDSATAPPKSGARSMQITLPQKVEIPGGKITLGVVALVLIAAIALAIPGVRHRIFRGQGQGAAQVAATKHIAVLPLRVIGDAAAIGYIGDGITDALTAKLFQLKEVQIAAPSAVARIKPDTPIADAAKALGANLIVSGTLQGQDDKVRLVLNLDDVASGKRWTQEFSGVKADLLTLEDNAYSKLVAAMSINASSDEIARTAAHPTENVDAYDLYLKGRNAMHGEVDAHSVQKAIDFYQQSLQRDASFALAYTGISDASMRMFTNTKDASWAQKALGAAQQAQTLADNLPEVHFSLGSIYTATGKAAEATAELTRALQLAPNSDEGYRRLGDAYRAAGKKDDALKAYLKATEINPYYWYNFNALGNAYLRFGDNDNALKAYQKVTELAPKNGLGFLNMGNAYYKMSKWEDAINSYKRSIEVEPVYLAYMNLGTTYFYLKRYPESVQMFEKAVELSPQQAMAVGNLADGYRWSGQKDKANATYDKAIALSLKGLQVDPRNSQVMASLALYYAKKGDTKSALNYIRRARAITPNEVNFICYEANIQAMAGNTKEALAGLRTALEKGYPVRELASDPYLYAMQSNPDFVALLKEFEAKK